MIEKHTYNGKILNPPNNYEATGYKLNYDVSGNANTQSTIDLEIGLGRSNDAYIEAEKWIENSITQGMPYKIEISDGKGKEFVMFEGYLDLWNATIDEQAKKIEAQATETRGLSWLAENGDAINFDLLYEQGFITDADFVNIPYLINRVGRNSETFLSLLTGYVVVTQVRTAIKDIAECVARLAGILTTIPAIVELAGLIIFLTFLLISLAAIILELMDLLISRVKYHKGMRVVDLINAGCKYFGLTLSSSILQNTDYRKMVILPEKYTLFQSNVRRFLGSIKTTEGTSRGYYRGTFGELIEAFRAAFFARIIIRDQVLYFEKDDYRVGAPAFKLPPLAGEYLKFKRNAEDFVSTFILEFITDTDDRNVIQNYKGTSVQVNTFPSTIGEQRNNLARKMDRVTIPFSLAKRKEKLNFVESVVDTFLQIVAGIVNGIIFGINALIDGVNALIRAMRSVISALSVIGIRIPFNPPPIRRLNPVNFDVISNRRNYLVMENDQVIVPKLMIMDDDGKISANNEQLLNARYLFENFHFYRNFQLGNNQWKAFELPQIQMTYSDIEKLRETNYIETASGQEAELLDFEVNPSLQVVSGNYRVRETYIDNLEVEIIEPE